MASDQLAARGPSNEAVYQALKELFSTVKLFADFPPELLEELRYASRFVNFEPNQEILKQGEINKNLYFLLIGRVDIIVDDGLVASLRRKGDILGEMSVITNKPCTATIVASTPVQLICVDIEELKRITANSLHYDHVLYRIYSTILSDKLNITNQRAKKLEETADALNRAKTELQEFNIQLEKRVIERTQALQTKLKTLMNDHLVSLKKTLMSSVQNAQGAVKSTLHEGIKEIADAITFIEPIIHMFNLEVSLKSKRILLAQGEKKAQTLTRLALGGTGIQMDLGSTPEEAQNFVNNSAYDVILIDDKSCDLMNLKVDRTPAPKYLFVGTQSVKDSLQKLTPMKKVPNLIFIDETDRANAIELLTTSVSKLTGQSIFGFEKYLNEGLDVRELKVQKSEDRKDLIQQMRDHFTRLGVRGSILDSVGAVLEEMLMNAIYDAPTDSAGNPVYNKLPRTTPVTLRPQEQGRLRFASDGTLLAVSVEDPFGALKPQILLSYLDSCYSGREGQMQVDKGGAGRGLHQIVENSEFVVFNVQPRFRTEVIAFFSLVPTAEVEKRPLLQYFVQN